MKAFNAINKYRRAHWLYNHGFKLLSRLYELRIYQAHNSFIPASAQIGEGTVFGYKGIGVIVHKRAVIGKNCIIGTNVTIGGKSGHYQVPRIGDNVDISTGAKILGPVTVGDGCVIGANAVVIKDCPPIRFGRVCPRVASRRQRSTRRRSASMRRTRGRIECPADYRLRSRLCVWFQLFDDGRCLI